MDDALYQTAIMRHAKAKIGAGRLDLPDGTATADNPLCGDRVTVDVTVTDGRITGLGHRVRGCMLCEAVASVLGEAAIGLGAHQIHAIADRFEAMIRSGGATPEDMPALDAFTPVQGAKSRHECVILPFTALKDALAALPQAQAAE